MRIYAPRLALIISLLKYASLSSSLILSRKSANVQEYQRSSRLFLTFPSSKRNDLPSKQFQSSTSDLDNVRHFEDKFPQIDKHSTPEFDSILSDYNDDLQSDIILFTDDQRFDSLLRAKSDSHGISGLHFAATLKTLAARRYHLDGSYNSEKRKQLIRTLSAQIAHKRVHLDEDSRTEFVEMLSNCVWALGTLKFSKEDFLPPTSQNLNGDTARLKKITNESNSWELLVSAAAQVCDDPKFYAKGDTRASDVPVYCISRVQLFRLISGLGKMGLKWKAMPPQLRDQFVWHTSHLCSGPRYAGGGYSSNLTDAEMGGNILKGCDVDTSLAVAAVTDSGSDSDNGSDRDVSIDPSREVASALYILGQVGATKEVLPEEYLQALIAQLNQDHVIQGAYVGCSFNIQYIYKYIYFEYACTYLRTCELIILTRFHCSGSV